MFLIDYKVVIPTYKRAGKVKTLKIFSNAILACHEFEAEEYKKAYPNNKLMILPDNIRGNMAKIRNFIRENSPSKYLIMADDDISNIGYFENNERYIFSQKHLDIKIKNGFEIAEELGTILWGLNVQSDKKFYREYSPISLTSVVLGTFCCHIVTDENLKKIRYDERLSLNEDYDFALQVLLEYRKILRFNKYFYEADHLTLKGGCASYRTLKEEEKQAEIMIKKWGNKIVKYDLKKSTNPIIKSPLKGI